jgi:hypothetical protein
MTVVSMEMMLGLDTIGPSTPLTRSPASYCGCGLIRSWLPGQPCAVSVGALTKLALHERTPLAVFLAGHADEDDGPQRVGRMRHQVPEFADGVRYRPQELAPVLRLHRVGAHELVHAALLHV